jgi:hypothetical protein
VAGKRRRAYQSSPPALIVHNSLLFSTHILTLPANNPVRTSCQSLPGPISSAYLVVNPTSAHLSFNTESLYVRVYIYGLLVQFHLDRPPSDLQIFEVSVVSHRRQETYYTPSQTPENSNTQHLVVQSRNNLQHLTFFIWERPVVRLHLSCALPRFVGCPRFPLLSVGPSLGDWIIYCIPALAPPRDRDTPLRSAPPISAPSQTPNSSQSLRRNLSLILNDLPTEQKDRLCHL